MNGGPKLPPSYLSCNSFLKEGNMQKKLDPDGTITYYSKERSWFI